MSTEKYPWSKIIPMRAGVQRVVECVCRQGGNGEKSTIGGKRGRFCVRLSLSSHGQNARRLNHTHVAWRPTNSGTFWLPLEASESCRGRCHRVDLHVHVHLSGGNATNPVCEIG